MTMENANATTDIFTSLPKVELHAHLNGSLSDKMITELLKRNPSASIEADSTMIEKGGKRTLEECFEMFRVIHQLTGTAEIITEITKSVIDDFAKENVHYLELRSTPRSNPATGLSKREYIDAVLRGITEYQGVIDVKFLLSVDRRKGLEEAADTIRLAKEYYLSANGIVLGVDLSGYPLAGRGEDFIPVLLDAKSCGLKLSLHLSEMKGMDDETYQMLQIPPDRIGHGTFIFDNEPCRKYVLQNRIPLEICLTSNVKGGTVANYAEDHHHIHRWQKLNHPVVICTDDKGVFSTTLSNEYRIASEYCGMDLPKIFESSKNSIDCIFAGEETKKRLHEKWDLWKRENLKN